MDYIPTPIKPQIFDYGANITLRRPMEGTPYESPIHTRKSKSQQGLQTAQSWQTEAAPIWQ